MKTEQEHYENWLDEQNGIIRGFPKEEVEFPMPLEDQPDLEPQLEDRKLCPVCKADMVNWSEVFHEPHYCKSNNKERN